VREEGREGRGRRGVWGFGIWVLGFGFTTENLRLIDICPEGGAAEGKRRGRGGTGGGKRLGAW